MRAHNDVIAVKYSFLEVLTTPLNHTPSMSERELGKLKQLRQHCLEPGRYHKYITKWLQYFPANHMLFVDGGMLNVHPSQVLAAIQKFLKVNIIDYGKTLRYVLHYQI